jgi:hypothetical protein
MAIAPSRFVFEGGARVLLLSILENPTAATVRFPTPLGSFSTASRHAAFLHEELLELKARSELTGRTDPVFVTQDATGESLASRSATLVAG